MTITTLAKVCPVAETIASARMIEGNTRIASITRRVISSTQPPR